METDGEISSMITGVTADVVTELDIDSSMEVDSASAAVAVGRGSGLSIETLSSNETITHVVIEPSPCRLLHVHVSSNNLDVIPVAIGWGNTSSGLGS